MDRLQSVPGKHYRSSHLEEVAAPERTMPDVHRRLERTSVAALVFEREYWLGCGSSSFGPIARLNRVVAPPPCSPAGSIVRPAGVGKSCFGSLVVLGRTDVRHECCVNSS